MIKSSKTNFKTLRSFLFLLPLQLALCGCPYSSNYKIDTEPQVLTDDALVGKWATMVVNGAGKSEPLKMIVEKRDEYYYDLMFTGNINDLRYFKVVKDDTVRAIAFLSEAASRRFLNIELQGQYYIAELKSTNDKINILPLCEHFTVKMIRANAELRLALELHYKTRLYPLYDAEFSLKEMSRVN